MAVLRVRESPTLLLSLGESVVVLLTYRQEALRSRIVMQRKEAAGGIGVGGVSGNRNVSMSGKFFVFSIY